VFFVEGGGEKGWVKEKEEKKEEKGKEGGITRAQEQGVCML
jgi:hypothetical protein